MCVPPRCQNCINSIQSCLCSGPALEPDSLLVGQQIPSLSFPVLGEGVVQKVLGICWFLSFLNVPFALVPRPHSWCPVCSLFPQRPHMPMPVYTTRRPSIPEPSLPTEARTENPDVRVRSHSTSPLSSPKVSLSPPSGPPGVQEMPVADTPQPARQPCVRADSLVVQQRAKRPFPVSLEDPQAGTKVHGLGHTQAPPKYPEENTCPAVSNALADNSQMALQTPGKNCAQMPLDRTQNPRKKARWSPTQHTPRSIQGAYLGISGSLCPPGSICARGCTAVPPQTRKTPALLPSRGTRPTPATPHLETLQPCTVSPRPPSVLAPTQPLRMVFTRLDRSCWSSRFLAAPSFLPPEKPGPAQGLPATQMLDGACDYVPWSILHDDLQVSSSSEDTESE